MENCLMKHHNHSKIIRYFYQPIFVNSSSALPLLSTPLRRLTFHLCDLVFNRQLEQKDRSNISNIDLFHIEPV